MNENTPLSHSARNAGTFSVAKVVILSGCAADGSGAADGPSGSGPGGGWGSGVHGARASVISVNPRTCRAPTLAVRSRG